MELGHLLFFHRQADESPPVGGHEVDGLGGDGLGGHAQVPLVLPVLVVDQDDHLARADVRDRGVDAAQDGRVRGHDGLVVGTGSLRRCHRLASPEWSRPDRRMQFRRFHDQDRAGSGAAGFEAPAYPLGWALGQAISR
jgi:hypothetical protein